MPNKQMIKVMARSLQQALNNTLHSANSVLLNLTEENKDEFDYMIDELDYITSALSSVASSCLFISMVTSIIKEEGTGHWEVINPEETDKVKRVQLKDMSSDGYLNWQLPPF